jgi:hypothetical protein
MAQLDPAWPHYRTAHLHFGGDRPWCIQPADQPIGPAAAATLRSRGLAGAFAVITAANPRGALRSAAENAEALQHLAAVLAGRGVVHLRCDGCCPAAIHREAGFAAVLPRREAIEIGAAFGQSAIYWFDGSTLWLVPVLEGGPPERLGGSAD